MAPLSRLRLAVVLVGVAGPAFAAAPAPVIPSLPGPVGVQRLNTRYSHLVRFAAKGDRLAWVEERGPIRIADLSTGKVRAVPYKPKAPVCDLHLSPDAKRAVVEERHEGYSLVALEATGAGSSRSLGTDIAGGFSSGGGHLPVYSYGSRRVTILDTEDMRRRWFDVAELLRAPLSLSGDGTVIAMQTDHSTRGQQALVIRDTKADKELLRIPSGHARALALHPDATSVAVAYPRRVVTLLEVPSGTALGWTRLPVEGVEQLVFSPSGLWLAALGDDGSVYVF